MSLTFVLIMCVTVDPLPLMAGMDVWYSTDGPGVGHPAVQTQIAIQYLTT